MALESADADGVTKGIEKGLKAVDIFNELMKKKLVGCNFNGASMMMGKRRGDPATPGENWQTRYRYPFSCS